MKYKIINIICFGINVVGPAKIKKFNNSLGNMVIYNEDYLCLNINVSQCKSVINKYYSIKKR